MANIGNPFTHPAVRWVLYGGGLLIVLAWLGGLLVIENWMYLPAPYRETVTWDNLLLASVIVLIVMSGLSMVIPLWLSAKQKRLEEERPY